MLFSLDADVKHADAATPADANDAADANAADATDAWKT